MACDASQAQGEDMLHQCNTAGINTAVHVLKNETTRLSFGEQSVLPLCSSRDYKKGCNMHIKVNLCQHAVPPAQGKSTTSTISDLFTSNVHIFPLLAH